MTGQLLLVKLFLVRAIDDNKNIRIMVVMEVVS